MPLLMPDDEAEEQDLWVMLAAMNSFVVDYVLRQKASGGNLNYYVLKQLPFPEPKIFHTSASWLASTVINWIAPRVLELTYTAWDLEPFARSYDGPPFRWDPERRFLLRCELDAAFFHLYGIGRDDADYIMGTFPIVKRKDEAAHDEYRTKRVILEIYDQMSRAAQTGQPYQTLLDPPPAQQAPGASEPGPATVTPLRPRPSHRPERRDERPAREELPSYDHAAEERSSYEPKLPDHHAPEPEEQPDAAPETAPADKLRSTTGAPQHQTPDEPQDAIAQPNAPEIPNLYEAALALNARVPDGQKIECEALLANAARELGHPSLTKKVRRALNQALKAEHNKGRLRTDWKLVWKSRKK